MLVPLFFSLFFASQRRVLFSGAARPRVASQRGAKEGGRETKGNVGGRDFGNRIVTRKRRLKQSCRPWLMRDTANRPLHTNDRACRRR